MSESDNIFSKLFFAQKTPCYLHFHRGCTDARAILRGFSRCYSACAPATFAEKRLAIFSGNVQSRKCQWGRGEGRIGSYERGAPPRSAGRLGKVRIVGRHMATSCVAAPAVAGEFCATHDGNVARATCLTIVNGPPDGLCAHCVVGCRESAQAVIPAGRKCPYVDNESVLSRCPLPLPPALCQL